MWKMPNTPPGRNLQSKTHKNYLKTCRLLAQTTLRNILGTKNLHEILSDRDSISGSMQVQHSDQ